LHNRKLKRRACKTPAQFRALPAPDENYRGR
jgi:hypothetical protein